MSVHATHAAAQSTEARIGEVLKRLREGRGLSLRTLATRADFSASFLSQLEHGQVSPSIASLERLAAALGITLADLFEASQSPAAAVVRAHARTAFASPWSRARLESLTPSAERRPLEAVAVIVGPGGDSGKGPAGHPADLFAYVIKGPITLFLGDEPLSLHTGDAATIPRRMPHRLENQAAGASEVLLVSSRLSA